MRSAWWMVLALLAGSVLPGTVQVAPAQPRDGEQVAAIRKAIPEVDRIFADFQLDAHVPGLVYGIVADGRLVHVKGLGVQDLEHRRPVTADSLFRVASNTKPLTDTLSQWVFHPRPLQRPIGLPFASDEMETKETCCLRLEGLL